jgi:hypothetical protein
MITFFIDKFRNGFVDRGLFFLIYKNIQSIFPHSHTNWPEIEEVNPLLYPASDFLIPPFSDSKMPE